jgi:hypothetical protein
MTRHSTTAAGDGFTPHASLAALGAKLRQLELFDVITQHVVIHQKTVKDSPTQKLADAFVAILAGAHGICEIETRLRCDAALQRAFGRERCAEQSVVQETLNAATPDTVRQMGFAFEILLAKHSRAARHPFAKQLLVLDLDLTGLLCGRRSEGALKGYFAMLTEPQRGHARGRQLARVTAAQSHEIIVDLLYPGNVVLESVLDDLVLALERALALTPDKRARTVLRIDAGGRSIGRVNRLLERGYHVVTKDCSTDRAEALCETVAEWFADPLNAWRELGWVTAEPTDYVRPVRRLGVRGRDAKGNHRTGVMITTLAPSQARAIAELSRPVPTHLARRREELIVSAWAYDLRAGAIEIENKQDKQGLGIRRRQKKRLAAAQMVTYLNALAHNVLIWSRHWLAEHAPGVARFGLLRLVRDLLAISGCVELTKQGELKRVRLNGRAPRAQLLAAAFNEAFKRDGIRARVSAE